MNTQRAAVALRHTIVGGVSSPASDSLANLSTHELPNGAEAYVTETLSAYRLDKTLTTAPGAAPDFVTPVAGPGIWVLVPGGSARGIAHFNGNAAFASADPQTVVQNTWHALPSDAPTVLYVGFGDFWAISPTTGVLTYSGPDDSRFLVTSNFSAFADSEGTEIVDVELAIDGALLGTTTSVYTSSQAGAGAEEQIAQISHTEIVTIDNGQTLQHVFRNTAVGPSDVGFTRYTVVLTPL